MKAVLILCALMYCANFVQTARILAVLPFPGKSHYIFQSSVLNVLAKRGHHIVEYSPFPPDKLMENYTHVYTYTHFEEGLKKISFEDIVNHSDKMKRFFGLSWLGIWDFIYPICSESFNEKNIKQLLQSNQHFDLVITQSTFGQESMLVFGHKFRAPTITLQGFQHSFTLNRDAGNDLALATIPESMSFAFTDQMTFMERFQNCVSAFLTLILYNYHQLPRQDDLVKKHYNVPDRPSVADMVKNVSLTLVNTHPAVFYSQPMSPNIIPIGGITINPERTPLPQDIKRFMDEAKEGVIYFSFGTVVPAHKMPPKFLQTFVNVFKKLPQKVLWRIETDDLPGLSKNVKVVNWVPQPGVLEHSNCVAFITHGGLFGQMEAIQAGVPTVGIPFFGDQFFNVRFNEHKGIGVQLDYNNLSEESLYSALSTLLNNPKYKKNAAKLSRVFRDRPMSAADTAVYWVEYAMRHNGAHHLRPAAASLAWYQLLLVDVMIVYMVILSIVLYAVYWIFRRILILVNGRKKKISPNKKYN